MSSDTAKSETRPSLRTQIMATVMVALPMAAVAAGVGGIRTALGVSLGAALGVANLWALGWVVCRLTAGTGSRAGWGVLAGLKFAALVAGCYFLLRSGAVELAPLVIGYGALPLGIVVGQVAFGRAEPEQECGDA